MRKSSKGWGRESPHQQNNDKEVQHAAITRISPSAEWPQGSTAWGKYNNLPSCWTTTKSSKGELEKLPTDGIFALFLLIDFFYWLLDCFLLVFSWFIYADLCTFEARQQMERGAIAKQLPGLVAMVCRASLEWKGMLLLVPSTMQSVANNNFNLISCWCCLTFSTRSWISTTKKASIWMASNT